MQLFRINQHLLIVCIHYSCFLIILIPNSCILHVKCMICV
nr:MAG TPA: hypothetical protein [Caudoviricetes sp.]